MCSTCEVKMVYVFGLGTGFGKRVLLLLVLPAVVTALLRESLPSADVEQMGLKG